MLPAHKGEIPFLLWLMPFIAGIALGLFPGGLSLFPYIAVITVAIIIVFVALNLFYNHLNADRYSWLGGLMLHVILICTGWLCCTQHNQLRSAQHFSKLRTNYMTVQIITEPQQKGIYTRFTAQVHSTVKNGKSVPCLGKLLVTLVADSNAHLLYYGDVILIPATYKPVDQPFNPAEFNYKQYLSHQNIYHQCFITPKEFRLLDRDAGNPVIAFSLRLRQQLVSSIRQYIRDPQAAAIASTLLLGYKADLSADVLQAYSKTGTIHVLSVSGAHVAVLFALIIFLLKPLNRHRYGKILKAVLSLTLIWAYAILTGLSPAVCRAAVMLSMIIIGQASGRPVHNLNVLAVSAFVLLLYDPFLITDVGFQLSYLAVFGLFAFQPIIYAQLKFEYKWADKFWNICAFSLAVQLITFPLSAFYFHQFPVYFLVSNLLIIIPAEALVIGGMLFLLSTTVSWLAPLSRILAYLLEQLILGMTRGLSYIEHLPYASIGKIWLTGLEHLALYLLIGLLITFFMYKKTWQLSTALAVALLLCISISWKAIEKRTTNHLVFFNMKKNSAVLFQNGNSAAVVTDLTLKEKSFQYSIQPCLDSLGVDSVTVCQPQQDLKTVYLRKQNHIIQFENKTILLFNPLLQSIVLPRKLAVDYLFFTQNPHSSIQFLRDNYTFKHFIADANNSTVRIARLQHEADSVHLKINALKRNNSYIATSN
jgi:competence protein ComEC